ncbi:hypothetical protein [Anaerotignum propionicum]|uniref:hypothetical protein n=1 Tax=Anaerotignum propionicum TaxID=28446 RepID=UPI00210F16D4|nr:hypothetical protein [Anaerotignum propionicum]MCQ4935022.1 hypothetical protein [Anaerotignum propionicum]
MQIHQYDIVKLKDGRVGCVVEKFSDTDFLVDVGSSPADWDTIDVKLDQINNVVK